jgi:hypothetical protein
VIDPICGGVLVVVASFFAVAVAILRCKSFCAIKIFFKLFECKGTAGFLRMQYHKRGIFWVMEKPKNLLQVLHGTALYCLNYDF